MNEDKKATEEIAQTDGGVQLIDGIRAVRECSFDPSAHFINLEKDPTKKPRLYLMVEWRVFWLQTWCQEHDATYLIEERPVESIPGTSWVQTACTVYINGEVAGQGVGGINLADSTEFNPIATCQTIAKGRALANAGFGSVFSSASDMESGGATPCDGGMGTDFFVFKPVDLNAASPMIGAAANTQAAPTAGAKTATVPAVHQPTQIPATDNLPKSREEALAFVVPMRGEWYGHPLSEVLAKSPSTVQWYADRSRNADLKAAAKLVLNQP